MKNSTKYIWQLLISTIFLFGCSEGFTDLKPYDSLPFDEALRTEADLDYAVNGMYAGMRNFNLFGRTLPFIGDIMADNAYISTSNSGRYIQENSYTLNAQNGDVSGLWEQAYTVILRANNIINADVPSSPAVDQYKGEALAIRAFVYWKLANLFGKPYLVDQNALAVPLVLSYDVALRPARNTVAEVYTQIITDLSQAIPLLTQVKNSSFVSQAFAQGILAKVYLYQGDYSKALSWAQAVVDEGGYSLIPAENLNAYWANPTPRSDKVETIFEVAADGVNNMGFNALANMYNQSGYGDGLASSELYALYRVTDARKGLILEGTRGGAEALIVNKYQNTQNTTDKDDIKVLRYAEVLLIAAEASARLQLESQALSYLNELTQQRDPAFGGYHESGTALLDIIIQERRKELAFEGDRFDDLNRLQEDIRRSSEYPPQALNIPAGDDRRIWPIPQVELDANPNMVQNTSY